MKLIFGIALGLGLMMLRDGIALGLIIALAVLPLFDWVFLTQDGEENFRAPGKPYITNRFRLFN